MTITAGMKDALTLLELQQCKYPVVSVTRGEGSLESDIKNNLNWLLGFKHVVLVMDNDDAGRAAIKQALPLFEPGRVKICKLPLKDPYAMYQAKREKELLQNIYFAQEYRPENLVTVQDII